ncbi:hypothetical protein FNH04_36955 [Streptomyces phyllanthi]|uniref:Uncharacterized protein n=1 Tax=Streptomyces phyllanthi TaxID=1803180 RepID=A0A5N8WGF1_9ACTN|nr:hypothetical protein [Streptomyces phyllanthi]
MKAGRYVRAGGALGHLLLVVVLALGVFAMHSVGHPRDASGHSASHTGTPDRAAPAGHGPMDAPAFTVTGSHATGPTDSPATHPPAMAMDMLSLCVAVLFGAWALAALLKSAFARDQDRWARLLARIAAALRPGPPPRRPDLTSLSVLRL